METIKDQLEKIKNSLYIERSNLYVEKGDSYAKCPRCHKYIKKIYLVDHLKLNHNTVSNRNLKTKKKKSKWIKKGCTNCKENIYFLQEWKKIPRFCKKCNEKRKIRKLLNKAKGQYARVSFSRISGYSVQGGSPGLGKKS